MTMKRRLGIVFLTAATVLQAAVAIHSNFEAGSIGRVEQLAPNHFRCHVLGGVRPAAPEPPGKLVLLRDRWGFWP